MQGKAGTLLWALLPNIRSNVGDLCFVGRWFSQYATNEDEQNHADDRSVDHNGTPRVGDHIGPPAIEFSLVTYSKSRNAVLSAGTEP